jgi:hypothetical protein
MGVISKLKAQQATHFLDSQEQGLLAILTHSKKCQLLTSSG